MVGLPIHYGFVGLTRKSQPVNTLTPWGADPVSVELYRPGAEPYELTVRDGATGELVGRAVTGVDATRPTRAD